MRKVSFILQFNSTQGIARSQAIISAAGDTRDGYPRLSLGDRHEPEPTKAKRRTESIHEAGISVPGLNFFNKLVSLQSSVMNLFRGKPQYQFVVESADRFKEDEALNIINAIIEVADGKVAVQIIDAIGSGPRENSVSMSKKDFIQLQEFPFGGTWNLKMEIG